MRFAVNREHRSIYQKHFAIELEELCSIEQLNSLSSSIDNALSQRLKVRPASIYRQTADALFFAGRDLWRSQEGIQKFVTQKSLANVAAEITEHRQLRLGYDQFFPSPEGLLATINENPYIQFLNGKVSLQEASCLQGVLCGLNICLSGENTNLEEEKRESSDTFINIFPGKAGNAILFAPHVAINWQQLFRHQGQRYLLIVYTQAKSVYVYNDGDPLAHELKQWGYALGDKLTDKLNPIVHR